MLQVLCDLLDLVQEMNVHLAEHTRGPPPVPSNAAVFVSAAAIADQFGGMMKNVTPQYF
ncbi:hypothetical protein [Pseudomonas monteilii]|uniref:hypothetical protein n=1 Tax=Pseudomonas monteilii TaxID=76759 RepID=UPI0002E212BD|nr:hypothetical protein [Pseudomonas monteilii]